MDRSYSREQLAYEAKLAEEDITEINQRRRAYNRLGFGYQVGFVRLNNRFPTQYPFEINLDLLTFVSVQLQIDESEIDSYQRRRQTISQHQIRIQSYLKLQKFGNLQREFLRQFIFEESTRLEQTHALFKRTLEFLKENRILRPATSTLERIIGEQRTQARQYIFERIIDAMPQGMEVKLDDMLSTENQSVSPLKRLKDPPGKAATTAMNRLTDKLASIEETGVLAIALGWLNNNYQRALSGYVRECNAYWLSQIEPSHRYAGIICFLQQTYQDTIDFIIDMYNKLIQKVEKQAKTTFNLELLHRRQSINQSLSMFMTVGGVVLDKAVDDQKVRSTIFSQVSEEDLAKQMVQLSDWEREKPNHLFRYVVDQFSYIRKFSPAFIKHLEFETAIKSHTSLVDATMLLKEMNETGKRKLPEEAPVSFIPRKLRGLVLGEDTIDKHAWESALLTKVRDEIKSGNLTVKNSKRFGPFDRFFISTDQWESTRQEFFAQSSLPEKGEDAAMYLTQRLAKAYDRFLASLPSNTYAKIDGKHWHLSVDSGEPLDPPAEAKRKQLNDWLEKKMRRIKLPQLLIEVDNELKFTRHFLPPTQSQARPVDEICSIIAAVMAHGCNIGPETMAQLTEGVTYRQIKRITDWQLTEENQRSALALVVNAIANLDIAQRWGQGRTSASDGQRFAFRSRVLQQTYSHKFNDFALEFYSFVADNYAPYYTVPIECNERDAPYVLDGVLYNESDLLLEEHYTDTHGYTEINFAAFAMLGKRFCPRIRKLKKQRIYRIDAQIDYGPLQPLINRRDRTIHMDWIIDQWDKMGQFYATLKSGHTTASVALKRLNSMSRTNRFYRANRELGRIFKTEFILEYMSQPSMRRQIRRGLLKVDQLHRLARDVAYGKRGRISKRDFLSLMKTCSCLTLILACIVYWQAKEIGRVLIEEDPESEGIDTSLLEHVSPIERGNIVLYGEYFIDRKWVR